MPVFSRRRVSGCAAVGLLVLAVVVRADDWSVTTADFRGHQAALRSIGPDGVHVADSASGPERTIPMEEFVSARHAAGKPPLAPPKFTLALSGGDRIVGTLTGVAGEYLTWDNPTMGSIPVPMDHLVALGKGRDVTVPDKAPEQDQITLVNGDAATGVFTDFADGKLKISVNGQITDIPLADVARISFATPPASTAAAGKFRVRMIDRSVLTVADLSLDKDKFTLTLDGKPPKTVTVSVNDVIGVEQLNGPVQWVSSLVPTESVQIPKIGGSPAYPAKFDLAVDGAPMTFDGRTTDHGIGVHAYSKLTFAVDPRWKYFRTQFAIDSRRDNPRNLADVTVRIKLDDKPAYEKTDVRVGPPAAATVIDLDGAKTITLECDYGPAGDVQAHLDWIEPAFTLVKPLPPVEPAVAATTEPTTMPTTEPAAIPATEPTTIPTTVPTSMPTTEPTTKPE